MVETAAGAGATTTGVGGAAGEAVEFLLASLAGDAFGANAGQIQFRLQS